MGFHVNWVQVGLKGQRNRSKLFFYESVVKNNSFTNFKLSEFNSRFLAAIFEFLAVNILFLEGTNTKIPE